MSQNIAFCKKEGLCLNCLISHKGSCTFPNRHRCVDEEPHHAFVCSSAKSDRKVGGVNLTTEVLSEYTVENTLRVLEDLNIDPQEFSEALGRDIFFQISDSYDDGDGTSGSDSDTGSVEQVRYLPFKNEHWS